jgi:PAS domain S-box-containing protein
MEGKNFSKALLLLSFVFLGLIIGVIFASTLDSTGMQYIIGIGLILIIVLLGLTISIVLRKQSKSPDEMKEGSEVGFVVDTFHDVVGKLKEKEKELQELRSRAENRAESMEIYNENILQSVPSGVITVGNDMIIKSINRAAEKILRIEAGEALRRDFMEVFREPLKSIMEENRVVARGEYQYVTDDGSHLWIGVTTSKLMNAEGQHIGFIFVFTDLTEIKALEAQVELKQRLSQLGEMSAGISHEMRNSMAVISGYAKLLLKKADESNKPTAEAIISEITVMDEVISELLAFAKPTVLNRKEINLHLLLREVVETTGRDIQDVKVSLQMEENLTIEADEVLLRQALSNICINAFEAMPQGGNFTMKLKRLQKKAEIYISDTGQGIPESIVQKIFLPFYTTKEKGVGMGLALVQKIIVHHGGTIAVNSREGNGSTFIITLPVVKEQGDAC